MGTLCIKACLLGWALFFSIVNEPNNFPFVITIYVLITVEAFTKRLLLGKSHIFLHCLQYLVVVAFTIFFLAYCRKVVWNTEIDLIFSNTNLTSFIESKLLSALTQTLLGFMLWFYGCFRFQAHFWSILRFPSNDDLNLSWTA